MSQSQIVQVQKLSYAALDGLDRQVEDFSVQQALLPLRPFEIEGAITFVDWEEYQGAQPKNAPPESEGLKFLIKISKVSEPAFTSGRGVVAPPVLRVGQEYPNIYFAKNPKLAFALPDHAKYRRRLLAAIAGADGTDAAFKPSAVLQQLRGQTLNIPMRMIRSYVRTTRNGADLFEDSFELLA
jgi:hypothetical protein